MCNGVTSVFGIIQKWYEGEYTPYENFDDSELVLSGGYYKKHWSSMFAYKLVQFYLAHWKWLWSTGIAVCSLIIAYKKLIP